MKKKTGYVRVDFVKCGGFDYTYAKSVHVLIKKISLYVTYVMQKDIY